MEWLAKIDPSLTDPRLLFFGISMVFCNLVMGFALYWNWWESRNAPQIVLRILCAARIDGKIKLSDREISESFQEATGLLVTIMNDGQENRVCKEAIAHLKRKGLVKSTSEFSTGEASFTKWTLTPQGLLRALRK